MGGGIGMKIPKKVKISGLTYDVKMPYNFTDNAEFWGLCCHQEQEIRISTKTTASIERKKESIDETFLHELLHAIDRIYNNASLTEEQVTRLSFGLHQVFKDNKIF